MHLGEQGELPGVVDRESAYGHCPIAVRHDVVDLELRGIGQGSDGLVDGGKPFPAAVFPAEPQVRRFV